MPVEVLYVHHDGAVVGSTISLHNLLMVLDRNIYRPRILLAADGPARQLFESLGIPVDVLAISAFWTFPGEPWYRGDYYRNFLALLPNQALASYLKQLNPDLIHINDKAMLSAGIEAKRLGFPVVWHLRSSYFPAYSRFQARLSRQIIRWAADRLIAISEDESDGFEDFTQLQIIHNSVDLNQSDLAENRCEKVRVELGVLPDQVLIGTVSSTISEVRGTWDFLRAAGLIKHLAPGFDLRFVVVADIPDRIPTLTRKGIRERLGLTEMVHPEDKAWQLAREGDIASQLILTGYRKDALDMMAAMDIVVVCNRHGVLGRMPFEAMSVGRPVVVTAGHSGRSNIIKDGQTGFIAKPSDSASIADAVVRLVIDPKLRQRMGETGREYSRQEFNPQSNAKKIEAIYQEVIRKRR